jgi:phage-related protein
MVVPTIEVRFGSSLEPGQTLLLLDQTEENQEVRMGQSGKLSRPTGSRTRRKRWKRRRSRCKRVHHPNARFLERWSPSISNDLWRAPSHRWNVPPCGRTRSLSPVKGVLRFPEHESRKMQTEVKGKR